MALVEVAGSEYLRLYVGDAFYDGEVVDIGPESMRIRFADGDETLWLTAGSSQLADADVSPSALVGNTSMDVRSEVRNQIERSVNRMLRQQAPSAHAQYDAIAGMLTRVLALPPGVQVIEVDGVEADSDATPVEQFADLLAEGVVLGVTIAGDPQRDRLYIKPRPDEPMPSEAAK